MLNADHRRKLLRKGKLSEMTPTRLRLNGSSCMSLYELISNRVGPWWVEQLLQRANRHARASKSEIGDGQSSVTKGKTVDTHNSSNKSGAAHCSEGSNP